MAVLLVTFGALTSCDQSDTGPQTVDVPHLPSGGDDDEEPIIMGDTTQIDP